MILDTCALLWLASGDRSRLSPKTLSKIDQAMNVSVVAISGFEVGIKHKAGKLYLPVASQEWFDAILQFHHIDVISMDINMCIRALNRDLPVVTADRRFADYGVTVWV